MSIYRRPERARGDVGAPRWVAGKNTYEDYMQDGNVRPDLLGANVNTIPVRGATQDMYDLRTDTYNPSNGLALQVAPNLADCTNEITSQTFSDITTLRQYNLYGMRDLDANHGVRTNNSAAALVTTFSRNFLTRGQRQLSASNELTPKEYWETAGGGYGRGQGKDYCNYAFFPAVRIQDHMVEVVAYAIVYSSQALGFLPDSEYVDFQCSRPRATVKVDRALILDNNCELAIIAGLNASSPQSGSYITIVPGFAIDFLEEQFDKGRYRRECGVRGASCGLAVQAAVCGLPSILYTGYTSQVDTDVDVVSRAQEEMLATKYGPGSAANIQSYKKPFETVRIGRGMQLIENVDHTSFKLAFAITHQLPIVFPRNSSLQQPLDAFLFRMSKTGGSILATLSSNIYTVAQLEDGVAIADKKTQLFMAASITDAAALASLAALAYMAPRLRAGIKPEFLNENENIAAAIARKNTYDRTKKIEATKKGKALARAKKINPARYAKDREGAQLRKLQATYEKQQKAAAAALKKKEERVAKLARGEKMYDNPNPLQRYIENPENQQQQLVLQAKNNQKLNSITRTLTRPGAPDTKTLLDRLTRERGLIAARSSAAAARATENVPPQQMTTSATAASSPNAGNAPGSLPLH